jgi:hydrogenase expression/formation protein HypE
MSDTNLMDKMACPLPITKQDTVQLSHGSGGRMMNDLISKLFVWAFDNPLLAQKEDQAVLDINGQRLAFSTDSFVVDPLFFPGGDIGELAVNGTVNDVSMSGARPLFLSAGFIIEEGFPLDDLRRITESMRDAARKAGVLIVTGDTKVVNKGKGDKVFINTAGIGVVEHDFNYGARQIRPGDKIILSGTIADHGMAIMSMREGLRFDAPIASDTAALNGMIADIVRTAGAGIRAMRDPTRGGLAATLNEFAEESKTMLRIRQAAIPVNEPVKGACEFLGLDPLYVANEGKLVVVVAEESAAKVLEKMRAHESGRQSAIIGEVSAERSGMVTMQTPLGTWRIVDMLVGEQLPRIC